jgi:hypothetical protein
VATAETARLIASLELKDMFSGTSDKIDRSLGRLDKGFARTQGRAYKAGAQIGTGIKSGAIIAAGAIGFLASQTLAGIRELGKLETATAQTNAVLASTKGVAGQTAVSVRALAEEYEGLNATIDDKVIQSGENLLLTFTKIRKDAFEPALVAALNLNTRLGGGEGGLQNTIKLVGKALNDPLKGLGALSKAGITFDKQQTDQIKTLVKNNDLLGAQNLILAELGKRYGGAFAAEGKTAEGTLKGIGDAVEDLQKALATGLFPVVQKVLPKIRFALADPKVIAEITKLGDGIAGLFSDENLAAGADFLKGAFETAKEAAPVVTEAAKATFALVKAAVGVFKSLPPELQKLAVGAFAVNKLTGGLVTNIGGAIAGGLASFLAKSFTGGMNVNAGVVNVSGAGAVGGGAAAVAGAGKSTIGKIASVAGKVFIIGAAVGVFAELKGILEEQSARNKEQASNLTAQTTVYVKSATLDEMKASLRGIEAYSADLLTGSKEFTAEGAAFSLNIDGVRTAVEQQTQSLRNAIAVAEGKAASMQVHAIDRAEGIASDKADAIRRAQQQAAIGVRRVEAAENRGALAIGHRIDAAKAKNTADTRSEAAVIRAAVDRARAAQTAATRATTEAVKDKDLSVTIPLTTNVVVTNGAISKVRTTAGKISGKKA